jgi:hypothetical protein
MQQRLNPPSANGTPTPRPQETAIGLVANELYDTIGTLADFATNLAKALRRTQQATVLAELADLNRRANALLQKICDWSDENGPIVRDVDKHLYSFTSRGCQVVAGSVVQLHDCGPANP